jgi:hypothetical protein
MFSRLKKQFLKQSEPEFRDSELGVLTFDQGLWTGKTQRDERVLNFTISGTKTGPNSSLLASARALSARFVEIESMAVEFLRSREPELRQARLSFYSFEFLWEDKPDDFTFEFLADGNDSQIWRVDFVGGRPTQTGFDD